MNPALLLCLMVCPLAFAMAGGFFYAGLAFPAILFIAIGVFPLAIAGWQLIIFTNENPDRLQREQHIERMSEIANQLVVRDGNDLKTVAISNQLTGNPGIEDLRGE